MTFAQSIKLLLSKKVIHIPKTTPTIRNLFLMILKNFESKNLCHISFCLLYGNFDKINNNFVLYTLYKTSKMIKPTLLVLAAGMGSRYGGLKQLDGVGPSGETIMDYSVYDAIRAGFGKVVFVIRKCFRTEFEERIRTRYGNVDELGFVEQELDLIPPGFTVNPERTKPWGTGHAVLVAADLIDTPFAVINADDYYGQNSFSVLGKFLSGQDGKTGEYCMVGFNISNTLSESGKVSRGLCTVDDCCYLTSVEEHHNIAREGETIYA